MGAIDSRWKYDGYVKVRVGMGRSARYREQWDWKCTVCGNTVRTPAGNQNAPSKPCPKCGFEESTKGLNE